MLRRVLAILFRLGLGGVFVAASVPKILDPAGFSRNVFHYEILPASLVNLVAVTLPWIELLVGLALIVGFRVRGAALVAMLSLVIFIAAMSSALARGLNIDCGCFKTSGTPLGPQRILGDIGMLIAAVLVYRWSWPRQESSIQAASSLAAHGSPSHVPRPGA
jgi:putative oxidoreductase